MNFMMAQKDFELDGGGRWLTKSLHYIVEIGLIMSFHSDRIVTTREAPTQQKIIFQPRYPSSSNSSWLSWLWPLLPISASHQEMSSDSQLASLQAVKIRFQFFLGGDGIAQRKRSRFPSSRPGFDYRRRLVSGRQINKKDNEIEPKKSIQFLMKIRVNIKNTSWADR